MKRFGSSFVRVGLAALLLSLFPALAGRAAQVRPLRVPDRPAFRLEVTVLQFDARNTPIPMPPEARLEKDGAVAFDVKPSRGGYLALVAAGRNGPPWLWPSIATGQPVTAQATVRVPEGKIRLRSPGPTRLSLVFSPVPLDGSAGRRWLQQIILREPKFEPNDRPAGSALLFEAALGDTDKAVAELELDHP